VLIDAKTVEAWDRAALKNYREAVSDVSQSREDPWPAMVDAVSGPNRSIIHAPDENVSLYLRNIQLLWKIGRYPSLVHLQEARRQRSDPPPEQQARILRAIPEPILPNPMNATVAIPFSRRLRTCIRYASTPVPSGF
jgi:hypothetical protein